MQMATVERAEPGDPTSNGIVDDPLEAGEPFVDATIQTATVRLTGNGQWDLGEEFVDFDGDGEYTPPRRSALARSDVRTDRLRLQPRRRYDRWPLVRRQRRWRLDDPTDGRLRYNGIIQRQTYARQLYCLMMLLVDENYIASQNVAANAEGNINLAVLLPRALVADRLRTGGRTRPHAGAPDMVPTPIQQDYDRRPTDRRTAGAPQAHRPPDRAMGDQRGRLPRCRLDHDAVRVRRESVRWLGRLRTIRESSDPIFVAIDGDLGTNENWGGVIHSRSTRRSSIRTAAVQPTNNRSRRRQRPPMPLAASSGASSGRSS